MPTSQVDAQGQRKSLVETLRRVRVREVMRPEPLCVEPKTPVARAVELMREQRRDCVLACDEGRIRGIFTERDYLMKVAGDPERISAPVETFMTEEPKTLTPDDSVGDLIRIVVSGGYRHVPVVEEGRV